MKVLSCCCMVASVALAFAEEPVWPADFWNQVAAGRQSVAARGEVREESSSAHSAFDTWAIVRVQSNGINFCSDRGGTVLIFR